MTRIGPAALALLLAACASGDVSSEIDGGAGGIDAAGDAPDASATTADAADAPDAGDGTPDADVTPDAELPPDADPSVPPTVLDVSPDTGSVAGGEPVVVTGNNFTSDVSIAFGAATATCSMMSSTTVNCTTPSVGTSGAVGVTATQTSGSHTLTDGFLYWDALGAVDDCNLVPPSHRDLVQGTAGTWEARVHEPGITDATTGVDPSGVLLGQIGYGPAGTDPTTAPGWTWFDVSPTSGYGPASPTYQADYDQYEIGETVPPRAQYAWSARFSIEAGASWKFCGAGTMTARQPIACTVDGECFADEKCLSGACRVFCDTNADCHPWGAHCAGLAFETDGTTLELFCDPGAPGGAGTGATCTADGDCESGLCLVDLSDTCTIGCGTDDGLCPTGDVCTEFSSLGLCSPSCLRNADCSAGHSCVINTNAGQDRYDLLCLVPSGTDPIGASCAVVNDCESGLCLADAGGDLCTGPCVTDADCPASMPTCGSASITRPSMVGDQFLDVCVP